MDVAQSILKLERSASEFKLLNVLRKLTVPALKILCKDIQVKSLGKKAKIICRLITCWKRVCDVQLADSEDLEHSTSANLTFLDRITSWTKDISFLKDFTFVQLYEYFINSKDKTFDKESMKGLNP